MNGHPARQRNRQAGCWHCLLNPGDSKTRRDCCGVLLRRFIVALCFGFPVIKSFTTKMSFPALLCLRHAGLFPRFNMFQPDVGGKGCHGVYSPSIMSADMIDGVLFHNYGTNSSNSLMSSSALNDTTSSCFDDSNLFDDSFGCGSSNFDGPSS
ncbi:hypothetical protein VQ7734_00060 [Vibrio quintilis]|uniref:Uncharacterized protein n=1 Tax=Vibrio quintilis TaxID=1117707 RepID=A0A1M7YPC8_9VIBR|nr:hypothetical protein [Vibrio quintilis]SHO54346.1 hypothetical protein VQ7734_00060 [Vibrio quintilis]